MAWYNNNWTKRKPITTGSSYMTLTASAIARPVYIPSDSDLAANAKSDGTDILFTKDDGTSKLNHEIVSFNSSTGELLAWVATPTNSTADVDVYMYYGYASATDQQAADVMWNNAFTLHMEEDPSGTAPQITDSSGNGINFTAQGTWASGDSVSGQLGNGLSFDETDSAYLSASDDTNADLGSGDWTYLTWIKPANLDADNSFTNDQGLCGKRLDADNRWYFRFRNVDYVQLFAEDATLASSWDVQNFPNAWVNGQWQRCAVRYDSSTGTLAVRRNNDADVSVTETHRDMTTAASFIIGARPTETAWFWEGDIDETRLFKGSYLSDSFLETTWLIENDPGGAITVGNEESYSAISSLSASTFSEDDSITANLSGFTNAPDSVVLKSFQGVQGVEVDQTVTGTPTTSAIDFTVVLADSTTDVGVPYGTVTVIVTDSITGDSAELSATIEPSGTNVYKNVANFPPPTGQLSILDGSGAKDGDQYEIETPDGSTSFTANSDGTLEIEPDGDYTFQARGWDASDSTWGSWTTIEVNVVDGSVVIIRKRILGKSTSGLMGYI